MQIFQGRNAAMGAGINEAGADECRTYGRSNERGENNLTDYLMPGEE